MLDSVEIPLPEGIITAEVDQHFENHGDSDEGHRAEVENDARKALKSQFLLDRIAEVEDVSVGEAELSQWLMMQAPRYGMSPDQFAQALVEADQVPMAVAEVRRGKALAVVLESAVITDTDGNPIDLSQLNPSSDIEAALAEAMAAAEGEAEDAEAADEAEGAAEVVAEESDKA